MVIVRESPRAKRSPDKNDAQWPPKSPFEALLSSPSGRKKWQERQTSRDARSVSPSPIRKSVLGAQKLREYTTAAGESDGEDDDDEEDEEILQLKLQQIEAKLKLKRLQKAKRQDNVGFAQQRQDVPKLEASPKRPTQLEGPRTHIEVPLSPVRVERAAQLQASPARVKLDLTEARRPQDVSLKRPRDSKYAGLGVYSDTGFVPADSRATSKPQSFGERLLGMKRTAELAELKREKLQSVRSSGFDRGSASASEENPTLSKDIPSTRSHDVGRVSTRKSRPEYKRDSPNPDERASQRARRDPIKDQSSDMGGYDPFSQIHLSKRNIAHADVAKEMAGKEIYPLPRLLKEVVSPEYEPPDCESDYVVFAILASKSDPFETAQHHKQTNGHPSDNLDVPRNKFMVLHLCDLKWEVDLYLFGTAFNQFWKLTPGTLLAILNPAIMPPKTNQHNGRFSLKLGSCDDAVMEIGKARDLGYCVSTKKDGAKCSAWVDSRKSEACDFHVELQLSKSRKNRIELNSTWNGGSPERRSGTRQIKQRRGKQKDGSTYHREFGRLYSVNTGMGKSAAGLLDDEDKVALDGMTSEEASRKRMAAAQHERDLAKRLAAIGGGAGAEYLRVKHPTAAREATREDVLAERETFFPTKPSAATLGLTANDPGSVRLSPAKDRKRHFGVGVINKASGGREAMGWGGARKAGLLQPLDTRDGRLGSPERGQTRLTDMLTTGQHGMVRPRSQDGSVGSLVSPQKKRARFALEKGIREPGRDSLPGAGDQDVLSGIHDDDDDDLDII